MRVKVLKPFPCVADDRGLTARELAADAIENVPDELVPGLTAEGYVEALEHEGEPSAPEPAPKADADEPAAPAAEPPPAPVTPAAAVDAHPNLTPAQEEALDRIADGQIKPGGAPKGGNRRKKAAP